MALVKIQDVVYHLDSEFRAALKDAVHATIPGAEFDSQRLLQEFLGAVYRKCSTWERVPDRLIKED